jgi:hypothetical protein
MGFSDDRGRPQSPAGNPLQFAALSPPHPRCPAKHVTLRPALIVALWRTRSTRDERRKSTETRMVRISAPAKCDEDRLVHSSSTARLSIKRLEAGSLSACRLPFFDEGAESCSSALASPERSPALCETGAYRRRWKYRGPIPAEPLAERDRPVYTAVGIVESKTEIPVINVFS